MSDVKWWLLDASEGDFALMYVGEHESDCKREWLRCGRPAKWQTVEMPAGDEEGLQIGVKAPREGVVRVRVTY
jgi:hypothetical protein